MKKFYLTKQNFLKKLYKKIEVLKFNHKPKDEKEKEEINKILMQANEMLEYRDKIIDAFKNGTFLSEYLKNLDEAGYKYIIKDVKKFTQEIESMSEKINLSLFKEFLNHHHQLIMQKCLLIQKIKIRTKNL